VVASLLHSFGWDNGFQKLIVKSFSSLTSLLNGSKEKIYSKSNCEAIAEAHHLWRETNL
jgi:hypothetical protein